MTRHPLRQLRHHVIAIGLVALAMVFRLMLTPYIGWREPFALFYVAVIAATWYGGAGVGIFALLLSAPVAVYFFVRPMNDLIIQFAHDWTALVFFLVFGLLLCLAVSSFRHTRHALRQERDWSRRVLASVADAVLVTDPQGHVRFMNPQAERLTGWSMDEARGQPVGDVLTMSQRNEACGPLTLEGRDGRITRVVVSRSTLIEAHGQTGGTVHVLHDVGETLAMQDALRGSEQRLRSVLDSGLLAIFFTDERHRIRDPNAEFLRMTGLRREEIAGTVLDWRTLSAPGWAEADERCLDALAADGICAAYEKQIRRHDGSLLWITCGARRLENNETVFFAIDSSERKRADEALTAQRHLLKTVVDATPDLIAYLGVDGRIRFANRGFELWAGGHPCVGETLASLLPDQWSPEDEGRLQRALAGDGSTRLRLLNGADGNARHANLAFLPHREQDGQVSGVVVHATDLTSFVQQQERLINEERRFRYLVQSTSSIVWRAAPDGRLLVAEGWTDFTGVPAPATLREMLAAGSGLAKEDVHDPLRGRSEIEDTFFELRNRHGEFRHVVMRAVPLRDDGGTVQEWIGTIRDVHDVRHAELRLERRERDLSLVLDTTSARLTYVAPDGTVLWANRMAARWLGSEPSTMRGQRLPELVGGESGELMSRQMAMARSGEPVEFEWAFNDPILGTSWSRSTITPDVDPNGAIAGYVILCVDVTQRRAMEDELRNSEMRLRLLIDFVPHMVWIADARGEPEFFNRRWYEYTGSAVGQSWKEAMHADDLPAFVAAWEAMIRDGSELVMEVRCRRADGDSWRWHVVRSAPLRDGQGEILRWYGTFTDIDDQKRAQRILTQAARKTDEFLGMLSHELRNPLASISAAAGVLALPALAEADRESACATVKRQTAAMRRMVDDLLDTARVSHGKIALKLEPTDLDELLRQIVIDQQQRLGVLGVALRYSSDVEGPALVLADPVRIQQCVVNLIANAARASRHGQAVGIRLAPGRTAAELTIEVEDQGWGIDAVLIDSIFEPFVQGTTATGRLGLGLALVRQVAQLHGGEISAQSDGAGRGATFHLYLPRTDSAPESTAPPTSPVRCARVVIIDDERDNASALRLFLKIIGHDVEVAFNAEDGLLLVEQFRPAVVICDLGLPPPLSGHDVARRIRSRHRGQSPYLIAFSGYGRPDDIERSRIAGFDTHIVKPASPQLINQAIQQGVARHQAGQAG